MGELLDFLRTLAPNGLNFDEQLGPDDRKHCRYATSCSQQLVPACFPAQAMSTG